MHTTVVLRTYFSVLRNATSRYNATVSDSHGHTSSRPFTRIFSSDASTSKPCITPIRGYSSQSTESSSSADNSSIFSPQNSPWDHVFEDIPTRHPLVPMAGDQPPRSERSSGSLLPRRQSMTNRELIVFDEMFNMIFAAVTERGLAEDGAASSAFDDVDTRTPLGDLLKNLPKQPRFRTKPDDPELDKLKEQLSLCQSDYAMLEWAEREVFGASIRAEKAARDAFSSGKLPPRHLQPRLYPHLLAALMSSAREKYDDPHLALALFEHARELSPLSYIFGCTTPAYNELLETRWGSFRDLRGVHAALDEMRANGISPDSRTRAMVDDIRRETGARTLWLEESETGSGEVWTILREIERLAARRAPRPSPTDGEYRPGLRRQQPEHDVWKNPELVVDDGAGYRFGEWPEPRRRWQARRRRVAQSS